MTLLRAVQITRGMTEGPRNYGHSTIRVRLKFKTARGDETRDNAKALLAVKGFNDLGLGSILQGLRSVVKDL